MNPGLPDEETVLLSPGTLTIGRTRDNQVVCMHKSLSRKHAQLEFDGKMVRVSDLQSKNGLFFDGKRVTTCNLVEGDTFRCGDITFLVEGSTGRVPKMTAGAQTLPSPLGLDSPLSKRVTKAIPAVLVEDDQRYKDKLFLLIRASELLVGEMPLDRLLDELVVLAVQVLDVDRIVLLALDPHTLEMTPKITKAFLGASTQAYSKRVVDWIVDNDRPTSFNDVSTDTTLPGDRTADAQIRGAVGVPINAGAGTVGVLYADSISRTNYFRPDDLAVFRALANIAAVAMDRHALRRNRASS